MGTVCPLCKGKVEIGCFLGCAALCPNSSPGIGHARWASVLLGHCPTLYQSRVDGTTDDAPGNEQPTCFCSAETDIRAGQDLGQQGNVPAGEDVAPALEQLGAVQRSQPGQQSDAPNDRKSESNATSECEHVADARPPHDEAQRPR